MIKSKKVIVFVRFHSNTQMPNNHVAGSKQGKILIQDLVVWFPGSNSQDDVFVWADLGPIRFLVASTSYCPSWATSITTVNHVFPVGKNDIYASSLNRYSSDGQIIKRTFNGPKYLFHIN